MVILSIIDIKKEYESEQMLLAAKALEEAAAAEEEGGAEGDAADKGDKPVDDKKDKGKGDDEQNKNPIQVIKFYFTIIINCSGF
jgi:hypothetical protein